MLVEALSVSMENMYPCGEWRSNDTCNTGSYAAGIQLEVTCAAN